MRENFTKKRALVALLTVFAFCSSSFLHAGEVTLSAGSGSLSVAGVSNIVFEKGFLPVSTGTNLPQTQSVAINSPIPVTNLGIEVSDYTLIGWSSMNVNMVISSSAAETAVKSLGNFYETGSSITIADPGTTTTLYAIWAIDKNNNGAPDYNDAATIDIRSLGAQSEMADQDNRISLRSMYLPAWNIEYDLPAYNDGVYYTGCTYNVIDYDGDGLTEDYLLHPAITFNRASQENLVPMYLIVEYGGVLANVGMIGGKNQKRIDRIKLEPGTFVTGVINDYPIKFDSVPEGGDASIKFYFVLDDGTFKTQPSPGDWLYPTWGVSWGTNIFYYRGQYSNSLTMNIKVYNKPEFESELISQYVDFDGYIDLKHVSGTPIKYLMRSINGQAWQPAAAPLTKKEIFSVGDGASICLREADHTIGGQKDLIDNYFLNPNRFNQSDFHANVVYWLPERSRQLSILTDVLWDKFVEYETLGTWPTPFSMGALLWPSIYGIYAPIGDDYLDGIMRALLVGMMDGTYGMFSPGDPEYFTMLDLYDQADALTDAAMPAIGRAMADEMEKSSPDACREVRCLAFETIDDPDILRPIEINTIPGVTSDPVAGIRHYIKSQKDFTFNLTFSGGSPLKVISTGFYSNIQTELKGTAVGSGKYSYTIRGVIEPMTITISSEPASGSVDNEFISDGSVWTYGNTLYIDTQKAARVNIYSISGALLKQMVVSAGMTKTQLNRGMYIIDMNGSRYKVVVQ